jgi:hypothetical protein
MHFIRVYVGKITKENLKKSKWWSVNDEVIPLSEGVQGEVIFNLLYFFF